MAKRKARKTATVKPISMISPVPAVVMEPISRPVSHKRLARLRVNWFVVGSVFGVAISFFMNFMVTAVVMPEYESVTGRHQGDIALDNSATPAAPVKEAMAAQAAAPQTDAPVDNTADAAPTPAEPSHSSFSLASLGQWFHHDSSADTAPAPDTATADATPAEPAAPAEPEYPRNLILKVSAGDTLVGMLLKHHVPNTEAHNVVEALRAKFNPRSLKIGQKISITLARHETLQDATSVKELAIKLPNLSTVELARDDDGGFNVAAIKAELEDHAFHGVGTVKTSLFQAGDDAGIPKGAMNEIVKAFSYDVDFQRDIHPGDKIEALLDRKETDDGKVGGYGNLRYAALTLHGHKMEIFSFKDSSGDYAWYDAKGNSVRKSLLRTPVNAVRITSGFGMRMHPILGYSKMHKGVDFGAAEGTPIYAAGNGVIEQRGWVNGYGNFILIRHNGTYETAYGHMSRFANNHVGSRVKQGEVIGYVGMTGRATGPHLHYEVRVNGTQVNPEAKQFNLASGLTGKQLKAFMASKQGIQHDLASIQPTNETALASR